MAKVYLTKKEEFDTEVAARESGDSALETSKADDSTVVHLDNRETITGAKTFTNTVFGLTCYKLMPGTASTSANLDFLTTPDNSHVLGLYGGFTPGGVPALKFYGTSYGANNGCLELLAASSETVQTSAILSPDGTFTWGGNNVLTSANGVTLDTAQEISGAKTFTSNILINKSTPVLTLQETDTARGDIYFNDNTGHSQACIRANVSGNLQIGRQAGDGKAGGTTAAWYNGPNIYLSNTGTIVLKTTDANGGSSKSFTINTDGEVTPASFLVVPSDWNGIRAGADNRVVSILGGSQSSTGGIIRASGSSNTDSTFGDGRCVLAPRDADGNRTYFKFCGDGTILKNNTDIIGVKNTPTAGTGITISNTTCTYTRVGNMVYVWGIPTIASGTYSSGSTFLSGLPTNISNAYGTGIISIGNNSYRLRMNLSGTTITWLDSCTLSSSAYGAFTFMYLAT